MSQEYLSSVRILNFGFFWHHVTGLNKEEQNNGLSHSQPQQKQTLTDKQPSYQTEWDFTALSFSLLPASWSVTWGRTDEVTDTVFDLF